MESETCGFGVLSDPSLQEYLRNSFSILRNDSNGHFPASPSVLFRIDPQNARNLMQIVGKTLANSNPIDFFLSQCPQGDILSIALLQALGHLETSESIIRLFALGKETGYWKLDHSDHQLFERRWFIDCASWRDSIKGSGY